MVHAHDDPFDLVGRLDEALGGLSDRVDGGAPAAAHGHEARDLAHHDLGVHLEHDRELPHRRTLVKDGSGFRIVSPILDIFNSGCH